MPQQSLLLAGRYRLLNVVASGGMGKVWEAADEVLGRRVAIKEVRFPADLPEGDRAILGDRTMREAKLTARLAHRNIITIYDVICVDDLPYIVMELVRAPSLAGRVDESGPLPPRRVAEIGLQLLDALAVAHSHGVLHRDVKPSNVLLPADRAVLTDFGIATSDGDATLTATGLLVGSPTYMSPERLRGEPIGPPADIWSLGATLYAALEGRPPFRADTVMSTITSVLVDEPPLPHVGGPLGQAILGMLDKDVSSRLTGQRAAALLRSFLRGPAVDRPAADAVQTSTVATSPPVMAPVVTWQRAPSSRPTGEAQLPSRGRRVVGSFAAVALGLGLLLVAAVFGPYLWGAISAATQSSNGHVATTTSTSGGSARHQHQHQHQHQHRHIRHGRSSSDSPRSSATPTTTGGPTSLPDNGIPAGYQLVADPLGFRLAVPDGWTRRIAGPSRVDYVSPDNPAMYLRIDQVPQAAPSAVQAWRQYEPTLAQQLPGFRLIGIRPLHFRSWKAADLEFTWQSGGGTLHVLDRGFITDPRGFALLISGPESSWRSQSLPVFDVAAATFEPTS